MIKYPNGLKNNFNDRQIASSNANRGITLESDINKTNEYYDDLEIAVVHKRPTPIQVVDVKYASRSTAEITKAFYTTPSTTDYNGVYKGMALDFEAKQTVSKTSFAFSLIAEHQVLHLQKVIKHGGIAFVIIRFVNHDKTFYVDAEKLCDLYYKERRSIPYQWFTENAHEIPFSLTPPVDYLKVINKIYFEGVQHGK